MFLNNNFNLPNTDFSDSELFGGFDSDYDGPAPVQQGSNGVLIIVIILIVIIVAVVVFVLISRSSSNATTPAPTTAYYEPTTLPYIPATLSPEQQAAIDRANAMLSVTSAPTTSVPTTLMPSGPKETFGVSGYENSKRDADAVCAKYNNSVVATYNDVSLAQKKGADWCSSGWVSDFPNPIYPSTTRLMTGCGNGSAKINEWTPPSGLAGVNCYGVKPPKGTAKILDFSETLWNSP